MLAPSSTLWPYASILSLVYQVNSIISRLGYSTNSYDFVLFLHLTNKGTILHLLYVIDLIITDDDLNGIQEFNNFLSQQINVKDLGNLNYFMGL